MDTGALVILVLSSLRTGGRQHASGGGGLLFTDQGPYVGGTLQEEADQSVVIVAAVKADAIVEQLTVSILYSKHIAEFPQAIHDDPHASRTIVGVFGWVARFIGCLDAILAITETTRLDGQS